MCAGRVTDVGLFEDMIASQRDVEMVLFFIDSLLRRSSQRLEIVGARRSWHFRKSLYIS